MFLEEVQLAVLGRKTPKEAVAAIVERIKPLIPTVRDALTGAVSWAWRRSPQRRPEARA